MAELPQFWKIIVPSNVLPRLNFFQNRIKSSLIHFQPEFQVDEDGSPIYQCLMQTTQSPTIFVFSGQVLDRGALINMLKLPKHLYHDLEISRKPLNEFENSFGDVKFSESPYVFLACLQVHHDGKRYADSCRKLKLSDETKHLMERMRSCIEYEEIRGILYAIDLDFEDGPTEAQVLKQVEEMMAPYECHDVLLWNKLFFTSETELPARISRLLEEKVRNTLTEIAGKLNDAISSYERAVSTVGDHDFRSEVVKKTLKTVHEQVKTWCTKNACTADVQRNIASNLARLIHAALTDDSIDVLLNQCPDILFQRNDIYNVAEMMYDSADLESALKGLMLAGDMHAHDLQQYPMDERLQEKILHHSLSSYSKRWSDAIRHLEDQTNITSKLSGALEEVLQKANMRLKEKVPHCLQVQAARMKEVKCLAVVDKRLNITVTKECYENESNCNNVIHDFSRLLTLADVTDIKMHKSEKDLQLYSLTPGSHIGFPNPKYAGSSRYRHGTVGTIATEAHDINYVITCSHVAEPGNPMYTLNGDYIGESTGESSISTSDESFGNLLDFAAIQTDLNAYCKGFNPSGNEAEIEVFDGDFEKLEGKNMFLFGATTQGPKWVKYLTNVSFDRDQADTGTRRNKETIPTQSMRGLDVVEAMTTEKPQPGDSGSLVCFHDTETDKIYGVFLFVGEYEENFACCRLCEGFDILADRGFTMQI